MGVGQAQSERACLGLQAVLEGQRRRGCDGEACCPFDELRRPSAAALERQAYDSGHAALMTPCWGMPESGACGISRQVGMLSDSSRRRCKSVKSLYSSVLHRGAFQCSFEVEFLLCGPPTWNACNGRRRPRENRMALSTTSTALTSRLRALTKTLRSATGLTSEEMSSFVSRAGPTATSVRSSGAKEHTDSMQRMPAIVFKAAGAAV